MGFWQGLGHFLNFCVAVLLVAMSSLIVSGGENSVNSTIIFAAVIVAAALIATIFSFCLIIKKCCSTSLRSNRENTDENEKLSEVYALIGQFFKLVVFVLSISLASVVLSQGSSTQTPSTITFCTIILVAALLGTCITTIQFAFALQSRCREKSVL